MINIFQPKVDSKSIDLLGDVFSSNWLGRGSYVETFECKLAKYLNIDIEKIHTIGSCTDAIFGVFKILDFPIHSEVIIPSISFPAVASAVIDSSLIPVIIDIDSTTGNICYEALQLAISNKTVAVFATHYGGIPLNTKLIREIVGPDILILEDAACAFGTKIDELSPGIEADFACWSFDAMKLLTCGEGGAFFFKDYKLMNVAKEYFYLGLPSQSKSGIDRISSDEMWWEYQLNCPGRRSIFTNINAAIGIPQFDNLDKSISRRQEIRSYYSNLLEKVNCNFLRQEDEKTIYSNYFFTIITKKRNELANHLKSNGIYSTFRYYPLHKIKIFEKFSTSCMNADIFSNSALNIPIHESLSDHDIEKIGSEMKNFFMR